ncbi:MAG: polymerase beta domain protein region [Acidimicrobiaceae bacterium]|nr:polymerase beta domain protein region [Acidimicrobiaceae bacterium]
MDLTNPISSITPAVEADVLDVLARTRSALTGLTVETAAGRSHAQVRAVLHRLVDTGLVSANRVGNAVQYRLNRDHVLADAVTLAADALGRVESRIETFLVSAVPKPEAAMLFGSFARRDGDNDSDVDLLLVRPDRIDDADPAWSSMRGALADQVERWSGNECQIFDLALRELREAARRNAPLIASLRSEGRVVLGGSFEELIAGLPTRTPRSQTGVR